MKTVDEKETQREFNKFSSYTENDKEKVLANQQKIQDLVEGSILSKFIDDIKLLFQMLKDSFSGKYKKIPFATIASIIGTLLYILSPADLIPDFIPIAGFLDDASMIKLCLKLCSNDIRKYKNWLNTQNENSNKKLLH